MKQIHVFLQKTCLTTRITSYYFRTCKRPGDKHHRGGIALDQAVSIRAVTKKDKRGNHE